MNAHVVRHLILVAALLIPGRYVLGQVAPALTSPAPGQAGSPSTVAPDSRPPGLRVDFPLLDLPYNAGNGGRAPSMRQSLAITTATYEAAHLAIQEAFGSRRKLGRFAVVLFDYASSIELPLPLLNAWLHEEFHRAVMGRRGIDSFNDVYLLRVGADAIAVSHVRDEDLVRLKARHPAEQVRLSSAGAEAETQMVLELQKNRFFRDSRAFNAPMYWFTKLGTIFYIASGDFSETNADTDEMNEQDGADVPRRDFTGHDFTAWAYDLHRPFEPYEARGLHPSGVGIDRYIKPVDLTSGERRYLRRQGRLQLLNFVDPFLFGFNGVEVGDAVLTANLNHTLAPFGHTVDANIFIRRDRLKMLLVLHGYANAAGTLPGVEVQTFDVELPRFGPEYTGSLRVALWMQPDDQLFRSDDAQPGGLAAASVHRQLGERFGIFGEVEAKTAGWVAGNVYLGGAIETRIGGSVRLR